jgi:class 3 adenylate cyclase
MHSNERPVKTEAFFEIPFAPEEVWPVLSQTDLLNRSAGLPPVDYKLTPLPEGGNRVVASTKFFGLPFEWEEKPFEWREPEFYRVERVFKKGPIVRIVGGMDFRSEAGKTRVRTYSEIYPRGGLGEAVAKYLLGPKATSGMDEVAKHVTEFLRGQKPESYPNLKKSEPNAGALESAIQRLRSLAGESELVARLEAFVRESADVDLSRIRPFAVARRWKTDRWEVLRLFLLATRAGLLDLSWEVLCPHCRSTRGPVIRTLDQIEPASSCEACQIRYDAEFDKSVELKFTVNPGIKICEEKTFCLAGPGTKPHVIAQIMVPPRGSRNLVLPPDPMGLRFRSPQISGMIQGEPMAGLSRLICRKDGFVVENGSSASVEIQNPNDNPVVVMLERSAWGEDVLTAAAVTNLQEFRDLFSRQVISPTEQIVVGQQIILFTDLRGSTAMYRGIGDAPAYAVVRDHFQLLHEVIGEHHGGIVKTIGDAVMAVFSSTTDALQAVRKMHVELAKVGSEPNQTPLTLKSSLHAGPCLAVNANERLDYFGTTVNLAARLVDCCQGGDLAVSDDFYSRPETQGFLAENGLSGATTEIHFRGFETPTKVWKIAVLNK